MSKCALKRCNALACRMTLFSREYAYAYQLVFVAEYVLTLHLFTSCPTRIPVQLYVPENPILAAWRGGSSLAAQPQFEQNLAVTKAEYEEHGHAVCRNKFHSVGFSVKHE